MRPKSLLLTSLVLGWFLSGVSPGQELQAVKTYARGDYAGAVKLLEPTYRSGEANIQQRLILARSYQHLGRGDDALGVLQSVLASDKENPEANSLRGRILLDRGRHKEALEYLKHAYRLKQDPATAAALGRCYYALGEPVKAKAKLEQALKVDVRDPGNSFLLGKICLQRGFGASAEKYLLMAEEAGMDSTELHELLGRAYLMQRKYVGPVRTRRLAKPARPGEIVDGLVVIGPEQGVAGRYKVATRYCALYEGCRLRKATPDSPEAHFLLATGWLAAGDIALAERHVRSLLQAEPRSRRAHELYARLLLAKKDYAALTKVLAEGEQTKRFTAPEIAGFYYRAAIALRAQGRRDQAVGMLAKAERLTPTDGRVLRSLATLHRAEGRREQARRYYARLVELFPDADDIDELRNALRVLGEKKEGAR